MRAFFLLLFVLLLAANSFCWYIESSWLQAWAAGPGPRLALSTFMVVEIFGLVWMFGGRIFGHQPGSGMGKPFLTLVMIWNMLCLIPLTAVILLVVVTEVILKLFWPSIGSSELAPLVKWFSLRLVFLGPFLTLLGTVVAVRQLERFRINRVTLRLPSLPSALDGLTIAHLSDLHVGHLTNGVVLDKVVAATNELKPDLIVFTGDLINMALEDLPRAIAVLQGMKSRYGLYLCEGNHDLIQDPAGFAAGLRKAGLNLLQEESITVPVAGEAVQIIGLHYHAQASAPDGSPVGAEARLAALRAQAPDAFSILLAHDPNWFTAAAAVGIPLTLAGHTHGGQLMLTPKIGFGSRLFRYWSGHYQIGAPQMFVSNGTGNWFPLRINAPAEIIYLTLRGA